MVSQNEPFVPIKDAWKADSRKMLPFDNEIARKQASSIDAKVLSNRKPPYSIIGGLYDALKDTGGDVLSANNEEGREAQKLFIKTEGIDIHPAAGIAVASLINSVKDGTVASDDLIMLNITGGGEARFKHDKKLYYLKPELVFDLDLELEDVADQIKSLFGIGATAKVEVLE